MVLKKFTVYLKIIIIISKFYYNNMTPISGLTFTIDDSTQSTTTLITGTSTAITVYALTTNLNSLSTNPILSINNLSSSGRRCFLQVRFLALALVLYSQSYTILQGYCIIISRRFRFFVIL